MPFYISFLRVEGAATDLKGSHGHSWSNLGKLDGVIRRSDENVTIMVSQYWPSQILKRGVAYCLTSILSSAAPIRNQLNEFNLLTRRLEESYRCLGR